VKLTHKNINFKVSGGLAISFFPFVFVAQKFKNYFMLHISDITSEMRGAEHHFDAAPGRTNNAAPTPVFALVQNFKN
jgi:hypothetical protein